MFWLGLCINQTLPRLSNSLATRKRARRIRFLDAPSGRTLILDALATIHWGQFQTYDQATEQFSESLAIRLKEFGVHDLQTLRVANILGDVLRDAGELERAEALAREWYEICLNHFGAEHEQTTRFTTNLADAFKRGGKLADAERLYRETLEAQRRALLPEHPDLPETMTSLAEVLVRQGDARAAIQFAEEAYESASKFEGPESIMKYLALMIRGWARLELREYAEAEKDLNEAADRLGQILGNSHPYALEARAHLERLPEIP